MFVAGFMPKTKKKTIHQIAKPYCFVSYSSREPHVNILLPCLWIALSPNFDLKLTPSALESGASQLATIKGLIAGCSFAVVVLDGLRPNVTYEYGLLDAQSKPVILLKEKSAAVDIKSLIGNTVDLGVAPPALNVDSQFSDVKDVNHAEWSRLRPCRGYQANSAGIQKEEIPNHGLHGHQRTRAMAYVKTNRTFVYGDFFLSGKKTGLTPIMQPFALEILREFSSTEFVGKLYVRLSDSWVPATRSMLHSYQWYETYQRTSSSRLAPPKPFIFGWRVQERGKWKTFGTKATSQVLMLPSPSSSGAASCPPAPAPPSIPTRGVF
jgi:hypothetical protein